MSTATSSLGPKVLALATLALAGFAYGKPAPEVWWWVVFLGSALAVATLVSAWQVKGARLAEPFTARVGSFVVAEIVLPVLALFAAVGAMPGLRLSSRGAAKS